MGSEGEAWLPSGLLPLSTHHSLSSVDPSLYKCVQDKMIRAYKQFRKKLSFMKHEKLLEDSGQDPIVEGVTFYVRYLGSCFVINQSGDEATGDAIKSIVSMVQLRQ